MRLWLNKEPFEGDTVIIPNIYMRKLRLTEILCHIQVLPMVGAFPIILSPRGWTALPPPADNCVTSLRLRTTSVGESTLLLLSLIKPVSSQFPPASGSCYCSCNSQRHLNFSGYLDFLSHLLG